MRPRRSRTPSRSLGAPGSRWCRTPASLLGPDAVDRTLTALSPDRLGHGVRSVEDPRTLDRVVADGVALEVCPGSNISLGVYDGIDDVPLRRLVDAGATVALGADDPLIFGSRLVEQYEVARVLEFSDAEPGRPRPGIAAGVAGADRGARDGIRRHRRLARGVTPGG